jgi:hypothetical protein
VHNIPTIIQHSLEGSGLGSQILINHAHVPETDFSKAAFHAVCVGGYTLTHKAHSTFHSIAEK